VTEAGAHRAPDMVWYAGYGSNLCAERFLCYIAGGTPRGASRRCRGARDKTDPRDDQPLEIPYRLYFSGHSTMWDGAPAFIDTVGSTEIPARARAYLITWEQFEDVVAQENRRPTTPIDLVPGELAVGSSNLIGAGLYPNLRCVGHLEGLPALTFTSARTMAEADLAPPADAYLETMIDGLRASHLMSDDALLAYLGATPGCSEELVAAVLAGTGR
jgi:hypothetical protein